MSSDEFSRRRREQELLTSAIQSAQKAVYRAYLQKADRLARLYRIDCLGSAWRCEVWFGASIHRTAIAPTRAHMVELRKQYEREVADLLADGWRLDADDLVEGPCQ